MGIFHTGGRLAMIVLAMSLLVACAAVDTTPQRPSVQQYHQRGLQQLAQGEVDAARRLLREMSINYPFHAETREIHVRLINGYQAAGRADEAVELADRFIAMFPGHKDVAYVHYLAGMADYERGRRNISRDVVTSDPTHAKAALVRFRTLLECCARTEHAFNARQYVYHLESMISLYELRYMEWDYDADRIDAAAQRGVSLLVSYPDSIAARRARVMLESDNFRRYRAEINRAIRESRPVQPVAEMAEPAPEEGPARYTIHVASAATIVALEQAVARLGLAGEVDYYRRDEQDGAFYYIAGYGAYPLREAAKEDRLRLRVRTEVPDLWLRSLEGSTPVTDLDALRRAELKAQTAASAQRLGGVPEVLPAQAAVATGAAPAESFYAIQLMSFPTLEPLERAVSDLAQVQEIGLYSHVVDGQIYFVALYGRFPDWSTGKTALDALARRTGRQDYWLRKIDGTAVRPVAH